MLSLFVGVNFVDFYYIWAVGSFREGALQGFVKRDGLAGNVIPAELL